MKMPAIFTERVARENFKDKIEVVMAVIVLASFAHKKYKEHQETTPEVEENIT